MHPAPTDIGLLAQWVIVACGGVGVFTATILSYIKKGKQNDNGSEVAVVSATFADRRTMEHVVEALDRNTSALDRHERAIHDNCEEGRRCRLAQEADTDALINLTRFLKGRME